MDRRVLPLLVLIMTVVVVLGACREAVPDAYSGHPSTPGLRVTFDAPSRQRDDCSSGFYWDQPACPLPPLVALDDIQAITGVDSIPPIDQPQFESIAMASSWLGPDSPIAVVQLGKRMKAYPLAILTYHEVVNDEIGGVPVVITYCPLCNTALAFRRTVQGEVLDFGTSGHLYRSNLVMYDRQDHNLWLQVSGTAVVGERWLGTELRGPADVSGRCR
ncbi:MAG: DUF3179 domain-containing (seleno)protein [Euzebya sp.]